MKPQEKINKIIDKNIKDLDHSRNNYFAAIKELVSGRNRENDAQNRAQWQEALDSVYEKLGLEIKENQGKPSQAVSFGTSGWRGLLGKDIFCRSVAFVTAAILSLYKDAEHNPEQRAALGIADFQEMRERGCVIGFDNRFGGEDLARAAVNVLAANGVKIYYAGESTTGTLSASVLIRKAAFSINLTPSHNPLEYGGFKYNAADAGPAAPVLTNRITVQANKILTDNGSELIPGHVDFQRPLSELQGIEQINALDDWQQLVADNIDLHGLDRTQTIARFNEATDLAVVVDCVHGASRKDIKDFFNNPAGDKLTILRGEADVTFGGIAPEPSTANMQPAIEVLATRAEPLKLGVVIDPDGDRIRFTDGTREITMNQFGAMAYHFLHEVKGKKGMVAKTVATSNLANALAGRLGEEVFEPRVGFKEFKPVLGKALVFFEESDGISVIGHTPEKDAYIGLLLALDMILTLRKNLGEYLDDIEKEYGAFFPDRDGVVVSQQGEQLRDTLAQLNKYDKGATVRLGEATKTITGVITIDGRKMILDDGGWLMIRPSGTEPKVRFYVEARSGEETARLMEAANSMLAEIGLLS